MLRELLTAANEPRFDQLGARVEIPSERRGRPWALRAWFAPAEPEVGIMRPALQVARAVDVDGEVYDDLTADELAPFMLVLIAAYEEEH